MSALLDSSKLLLNIFTSFHSERAVVNHDRLQAMQSCIFTIRPIAPLSTKLNSFNCTSSQNAIPLKGHSPLQYAIPANYRLLTSLSFSHLHLYMLDSRLAESVLASILKGSVNEKSTCDQLSRQSTSSDPDVPQYGIPQSSVNCNRTTTSCCLLVPKIDTHGSTLPTAR